MNYRDLEIWRLAREVALLVYNMSIEKLPKHELYETGSQIRRASASVRSNIVEGYGRRRYKQDFIKHLTYAHASADEAIDHLEYLFECGALKDEALYRDLVRKMEELGGKLNRFITAVEAGHRTGGRGMGDA